jgi:hypothetical protein
VRIVGSWQLAVGSWQLAVGSWSMSDLQAVSTMEIKKGLGIKCQVLDSFD